MFRLKLFFLDYFSFKFVSFSQPTLKLFWRACIQMGSIKVEQRVFTEKNEVKSSGFKKCGVASVHTMWSKVLKSWILYFYLLISYLHVRNIQAVAYNGARMVLSWNCKKIKYDFINILTPYCVVECSNCRGSFLLCKWSICLLEIGTKKSNFSRVHFMRLCLYFTFAKGQITSEEI